MKKQKKLPPVNIVLIILIFASAFIAGYICKSSRIKHSPPREATATQKWTCSMHPSVIQDTPGACPICGMDLIPLKTDTLSVNELKFSAEAVKLLDIETSPVQQKFVAVETRLVGTIVYDETRIKKISAWVPGRIDRLYVDFTGTTVSKGDHLVYLYSPQLISAQAELIQALKAVNELKPDTSELVKNSTLANLEGAKEKLRLLGLTDQQISDIQKNGKPQSHLTIYSPIGGIVIVKNAVEGMYIDTGTPVYTVADLSRLWVQLDAYESDLPWIKYGQEVQFTTEACPGDVFTGVISFIDPILNPKTRTVKLRVNVDNTDGKLKPNMFVRATLTSTIAEGGRVMVPAMANKWICPMHPDIVKESPGTCDICQMNLVTTESLGYVNANEFGKVPLVIPASAPLITGKRAVVYVKHVRNEDLFFEGRQIVLGPRAGDYYIVKSGLLVGEEVVTHGNFKIDSEMQIMAKPSMMNTEADRMPHTDHDAHEMPPAMQMAQEEMIEQKTCPVMGGPINKDVFTVYKGKKVYFCCPGCDQVFNENPEKYLDKLPQFKSN
ncbi:MAG: efflux RND transporter periplasmic adaptor subunit [Sedimentisphaerales bacterium]|nr:efflux RND transporter periplasmic adaptor subunit [Sedimentisphaerales bacterium]